MNKNPFVPTAAYTPQQPPLPPGPPPPQPTQPDYAAYWTAAAAAQHVQAPTVGTYNPQWTAAQHAQPATAPRPTAEQSALFANYGYGNQQNLAWQQQQRQPQPHFQPPPPVVQPPPPPPPQPAYNPYQPQAGAYQQPYVPQGGPAPQQVPQTPYQPQVAPQPFQQQQQQQFYHPQQQQQQRPNNRNIHHASPQQLPPAKRQRFDGPSQHRGPPPPQPQFQPPPPPPMQQGGGMNMFNQNQGQGFGRGGGPVMSQMQMGGGRGGYGGGRGGNNMGGRGRGAPMGMNRGGNRGRGSYNNLGGRGGGMIQSGGSFRGHGPTRGFGNRDNRRGGSFNAGGQGYSHGYQQQHQQQHHHHQHNYQNNSFRGRNQSFSQSSRGSRHDSGPAHSSRDNVNAMSAGFSTGKKDENRRTLTDFKIIGLEMPELSWSWGVSKSESTDVTVKKEKTESAVPSDSASNPQTPASPAKSEAIPSGSDATVTATAVGEVPPAAEGAPVKTEPIALLPPPPSRIRIYFHTPVTADDSHPIPSQTSYSLGQSSTTRKGKRKKLEDDDGDVEDGRGPPPPPPHSSDMANEHADASVAPSMDYDGTDTAVGRDSVAPSVAETTSEADWLMAAIGGEEGEGEEGDHDNANGAEQYHDADAEGEFGKPPTPRSSSCTCERAPRSNECVRATDTRFLKKAMDMMACKGRVRTSIIRWVMRMPMALLMSSMTKAPRLRDMLSCSLIPTALKVSTPQSILLWPMFQMLQQGAPLTTRVVR
ncbi:uncharacterized protein LAESUDRAFT_31317 [Laetiporus sulphureus 93-53]|uniref:Uncharacterized protein n=1 Tax=Laetiporus sulphureus 93-53 TaxID=1314785 RepID=A0A165IJ72_9APHY|nr:uncharacterized protein LAESUDRAFT_31317 [Laetiporus sulphureus 93-53]KZT13152.1 hypothetical protein LAESUDRAFT_31317 [Laetiporus sulphureus 93-53]